MHLAGKRRTALNCTYRVFHFTGNGGMSRERLKLSKECSHDSYVVHPVKPREENREIESETAILSPCYLDRRTFKQNIYCTT